jgi:hypothetical protein
MRSRQQRRWPCAVLWLLTTAILVGPAGKAATAAEPEPVRLYIGVDKAQLVVVPQEPFSKVLLANPNIADVQVITPTQLLITGKAAGVTSLLLMYPNRVQFFDLVVHPGPLGRVGVSPGNAEPHAVLVQRADKVSESIFIKDKDQSWIELGGVKPEQPEAAKK